MAKKKPSKRFEKIDDSAIPDAQTGNQMPDKHKCKSCEVIKPLTADYFELDEHGKSISGICRSCMSNSGPIKAEADREMTMASAVSELMSASKHDQLRCPHIAVICATVFSHAGGVDAVSRKIVEAIAEQERKVFEENASPKTLIESYKFLVNMAKESRQEMREDVKDLTDQQLSDELMRLIQTHAGNTQINNVIDIPKRIEPPNDGAEPK